MFQARDKYVQRKKAEGTAIPASMLKSANAFQELNMKTVHPEVPNFTDKKKMSKMGRSCLPKSYDRFFTVDQDNFQYFVAKESSIAKRTMPIKESNAFIQSKS
jgi:hypothetical protein